MLNLFHPVEQLGNGLVCRLPNTSAWTNGVTSNWATLPSVDATPAAVLNLVVGAYDQNETYSLDVTSTVAGWVDGTYANYGFTLARTDAPNRYLYFQGGTARCYRSPCG